ncbi:MAG: AI-2E family transporter, partial [Pseudomonadales bacterium]|nr:AI-2E family transporter [Pseudomonadales bacterium]
MDGPNNLDREEARLHVSGMSLVVIAALIVIAAGLKSSQDLMVPFLLSVFIATIAATPMFWLQRKGVPEAFSLPIVMILMVFTIVLMGMLIAQSTSAFSAKLPFYQERLLLLQRDAIEMLRPILEPLNITDLAIITTNFSPNSALELAGTTLA